MTSFVERLKNRRLGYPVGNKLGTKLLAMDLGIKVPELYWAGYNLGRLPKSFVIKPNKLCSSRGVFLVKDGHLDDRILNFYRNYNDLIIVEELLEDNTDYKFYVFPSGAVCTKVVKRDPTISYRYYDGDWRPMDGIYDGFVREHDPEPKPPDYDLMLESAIKIGHWFEDFVRVDMYRGGYLGEICGTPHGGRGYTPYGNKFLGDLWDDRRL